MSQTNCPRCNDPVRFPADLPSEAIVRCPLCTEEYRFAEMQASLPPMVEVVSLPESADEALGDIDELLSAKSGAASVALVEAPRIGAPRVRSSARRRPAESPWRPLVLFIEIALSGVVGIALAVLVLWWLPGQWHRDPLSLKPVAAKYAPWLLPPVHRPVANQEAEEDASTAASRRAQADSNARPTQSKPKNESQELPSSRPASFEEPEPTKSPAQPRDPANNTAQKPAIDSQENSSPQLEEPKSQPSTELVKKPAPSAMSDLTKDLPPDHWLNQPEAPPEPPDLAWTGSPEITSLLRDAERRRKDPPKPNLDFPERTEPDFLTTFHELARVASQVDNEDIGLDTARTRLSEWLATLSPDEWKSALEKTAKSLSKDSIAPRGVIYLAKLKQAAAEGSWLHLELEPNPGDPTFPILIEPTLFRASGGDSLVGKEVYLLASELPDPKRLVTDVPGGVKKTWLIGAIRPADTTAAESANSQKSAF